MNQEHIQQAARDEALVPSDDRVKISSSNMRIDPTMTQKESTYQFDLDDKKFQFDVELFWKIRRIYPRVPNKEFVVPSSHDSLVTFLKELSYKGPLEMVSDLYIDYIHRPWRTLATIINKCLSGKTPGNDRLRQSRAAILWALFHKENVDFAELIWEDFIYQIDYRQSKPILDKMVNDEIVKSKAYQTYLALSIGITPPKKGGGRGGKGKRATVTSTKKSSIIADDNILPDPDEALKLGKSISRTEVEIAEEERHVHETHERLVTEQTEIAGSRMIQENLLV
ncbi:hypothetical protein Tco_1200088 [Tanacetum coccineum]